MKIRLEAVTNVEQEAAAARVRREVFGTAWALELCRIAPNDLSRANHLIARVLPEEKVIATVTILDTTGIGDMHEKYELPFGRFDRVGRYTQMAVLKSYRGLNLPLYMLLEANRLFVIPGGFEYTWLLFRAERAVSSKFCRMLGFSAGSQIVPGEEGPCRVLLRDEKAFEAHLADKQAMSFLERVRPSRLELVPTLQAAAPAAYEPEAFGRPGVRAYSGLVREDEWVAQ